MTAEASARERDWPGPPPTLGRTARGENFPVASRLLSERVRPHVAAFYRFARAADDIADDPRLPPEEKLDRLRLLDRLLAGAEEGPDDPAAEAARALRTSLAETGVSAVHARHLLQAFQRDALTRRTPTWGQLLAYCRYSAIPVGRYLLEIHGEREVRALRASDSLCVALQVINHLQDCRADYETLDRVYIPSDWLAEAGIGADSLGAERSSPELRSVFARMLERVDLLVAGARPLVAAVRDLRLRLDSAVIVVLAARLARKLRRADPLAGGARLTRLEAALAAGHGLLLGLVRR